MINDDVGFVRHLVSRFPELSTMFDEHVRDNLGEILPHVFFGDVSRYVLSTMKRSREQHDPNALSRLLELLAFLETSFAEGDREIRELLAASFIENIPRDGEPGAEIRGMLGEGLRRQLMLSDVAPSTIGQAGRDIGPAYDGPKDTEGPRGHCDPGVQART